MKKAVAFSLALVLAVSLCASAFAAKPTVRLPASQRMLTVRRGRTVTFRYQVSSGSYRRKYGVYRASVWGKIYRNGRQIAETRTPFTGTRTQKVKWIVPRSASRGTYVNYYAPCYRVGYSNVFRLAHPWKVSYVYVR